MPGSRSRNARPSATIRYSRAAERDLLGIWDFISAQSGTAQADAVLRRIEKALKRLERFPHLGRSRPEYGPNARSAVQESWIIYYDLIREERSILVARILHAARDQAAVLEQGKV